MIAIPGRYKPDTITSVAVYLPGAPNGLFIFSRVTILNNVIKFFNWLNETNNVYREESKSFIFINNNLKPLMLMNVNNVNQPVYIYSEKDPITEDIINLDYFSAQFYNYSQKGFMTSIVFGLNGFTEALAAYNKEFTGN